MTLNYHIITYGCQMNTADSMEMAQHLWDRGFAPTDDMDEATVLLVNTCTVRDHAEHRALSQIGRLKEWKESDPRRLLVVAGCAAERLKTELPKRFPHVDAVVGAKDMEEWNSKMNLVLERQGLEHGRSPEETLPSAVRGHVTIMRGCNYSCTYCIVPAVRGREIYRDPETIISEITRASAQGAKEILLLGQTVNSYKHQQPDGTAMDFSDLLLRVAEISGIERIRFMSPHPYYYGPKLVETLASSPKFSRHVHLPMQSGSDRLLKRMRRNYTRSQFASVVQSLREKMPGLAITTDIIVGFPGETEEDFQETLSAIRENDFDSAYCFKFSPRPGTEAASYEDRVPRAVMEERLKRLMELTDQLTLAKSQTYVNTTQEVLVEDKARDGSLWGRTSSYRKVFFQGPDTLLGALCRVRVTGFRQQTLEAELCN